jgi:hypothetical protein
VVGGGFARRQLGLADPMIDLRLFRIRAFNASLATNLLGIFIVVGYFLFVAQYLQLVLGLSPLGAGLWWLPSAGGFIVGSNLAPRILRHLRPASVIGAGLALAAVGLGVLTRVGGSPDADLAILAGASLVVSLGLAPVFTATDLIVGSAPPERAGAASGISETGAELGGALGIAILGSIGVALYRSELADTLPAGIPSQAAAVARDTLGGAVGVAHQLPADVGAALLAAAREAFTQGLQVTAASSAAVAVGIAVGPRSCSVACPGPPRLRSPGSQPSPPSQTSPPGPRSPSSSSGLVEVALHARVSTGQRPPSSTTAPPRPRRPPSRCGYEPHPPHQAARPADSHNLNQDTECRKARSPGRETDGPGRRPLLHDLGVRLSKDSIIHDPRRHPTRSRD